MTNKIKANELKQGDKISAELWSNLWGRKIMQTCTVVSVTECENGSRNILVKAWDGCKQYMTDIFAKAGTEYAAA